MKIAILRLVAAWLALGVGAAPGSAQTASSAFPTRPVHIVVPYPPGGSADILARLLGERLQAAMGQTFVIENKPGAGTAIGAKAVAQSPGDGYTLLIGTVSSQAMNPAMAANVGYDPIKDFTTVAPLAEIPFALLAHPKLEVNALPDLVALAKRQPDKLNFSSAGNGTSNHLAGELLNSSAGVRIVHIPYKGSAPALQALRAGEVDIMFDLMMTAVPYAKSGPLKVLAITADRRSPLLPEVPAVGELGMSALTLSAWFGLFGPRDMPKDVAVSLAAETAKVIAAADVRERLQGLGAMPMDMAPAKFDEFVKRERDRWAETIKKAGIKAE